MMNVKPKSHPNVCLLMATVHWVALADSVRTLLLHCTYMPWANCGPVDGDHEEVLSSGKIIHTSITKPRFGYVT